jgi:hypothetical protein
MKLQKVLIFGLLGCCLLTACGTSDPIASQIEAWREAGLEPSEFEKEKTDKFGSGECYKGKVSGIEVSLCRFTDEEASSAATDKGRKSIGSATGVALTRGRELMVAVDRAKGDRNGHTLNKISKVFWELD